MAMRMMLMALKIIFRKVMMMIIDDLPIIMLIMILGKYLKTY